MCKERFVEGLFGWQEISMQVPLLVWLEIAECDLALKPDRAEHMVKFEIVSVGKPGHLDGILPPPEVDKQLWTRRYMSPLVMSG